MLPATRFRSHGQSAGFDHEIPPVQVHRFILRMSQSSNQPAIAAGRTVDPIVQPPEKCVQHCLHIDSLQPLGKTRENCFSNIRFPVPVRVLQVNNVRRCCHEHAAVIAKYRCRPGKVGREEGALLVNTVAIQVFQQTNPAQVRRFVPAFRVIHHFHHKHSPVFIKTDRHWADDLRLRRDQFKVKSLFDLKRSKCSVRRNRWKPRQVVRTQRRFGGSRREAYQDRAKATGAKHAFHHGWLKSHARLAEGSSILTAFSYCFPIGHCYSPIVVGNKTDVWQGTLALMVLKTLEGSGPMHGYGIARQIEQTSSDLLSVNYGTLYPALIKLEQEGVISSKWGVSDNNRKAKYYELTRAGRR